MRPGGGSRVYEHGEGMMWRCTPRYHRYWRFAHTWAPGGERGEVNALAQGFGCVCGAGGVCVGWGGIGGRWVGGRR
jgi:hypothetical protein